MRRVEPRQLTFVFADSPEGGKGSRKRDESRGRPYLLHIAKAMTATSSTTTENWSRVNFLCLTMKNSFQRAGCEAHKSGSVRGVVGRPAIPTRQISPTVVLRRGSAIPK